MEKMEKAALQRGTFRGMGIFCVLMEMEEAKRRCLLLVYDSCSINPCRMNIVGRSLSFPSPHIVEVKMFKIHFAQSLVLPVDGRGCQEH